MDGRPRRWGRRLAWLGGRLLVLAVLLAAAAPLILRGPVLRWALARATERLCGRFNVEGGHFGLALVPNLLLGRPVSVELEGLRVTAPDGSEVMAAASVHARVDVFRHPWRAVVHEGVASHGRWRMAVGGAPGSGLIDVFRLVP